MARSGVVSGFESALAIALGVADPFPGPRHGEEIAKEPQDQGVIASTAAEAADDRSAGHAQVADRREHAVANRPAG